MNEKHVTTGRTALAWALYLLPAPVLVAALFIGPSSMVRAGHVWQWLCAELFHMQLSPDVNDYLVRSVVLNIRLPRAILTFLVGGALGASGAAMQSVFRNPLVSPFILGLSAAAAFGAALALATGWIPVQAAAFACGMLAVGLSYFLARSGKSVSVVALVLSGIIVSGFFTALLTIVQFLTDPFKLQTIVHWTMGNLHTANWDKVLSAAPLILAGAAGMFLFRWRMNVLAMGDEETRAVGLNPEREKLNVLAPATLAASAAVAVGGVIGLVGLIIPHMVRMMLGPDNSRSVPACFTFGGAFLLIVDTCSRAVTSFEIPIGIFTTLIGSPFFIYLLKKSRIGWNL
jgi:iron complex transport system permease protein